MRTSVTRSTMALLAILSVLVMAACGSGGNSSKSKTTASGQASGGRYNAALPSGNQKRGGTLTVLANSGFQHLDPGAAYYQLDYAVEFAVHRPLYYFRPETPGQPVPDLAAEAPVISDGGRTVTVKIRPGIKYGTNDPSSSANGKEVTSADLKYAIERTYNSHVPNGYNASYFPIVGADNAKGGPISGITTPDSTTLVLKLSRPFGATTAKALVMPIAMPVPKSYSAQYDAENPSGFERDPTKEAFTGPYMISAYSPGKSLTLVRNPQWNGPDTHDIRPAYLDKIVWKLGGDPNVIGRQIFNGKSMVNGDTLAAPIVKQFATRKPRQISFTPNGNRFVSLNYTKKPFSDANVRKAAAAVLDRAAMQRVRGGAIVGDVGTHFIPPGIPGFEEAGGMAGPAVDFLKNPSGDLELAKSYMKKAGYPNGVANGEQLRVIGDNESPAKEDAQVVQNSLEKLGFKVKLISVERSTYYSKYCTATEALHTIDVCTNSGWLPDFADPYAMLYVNFHGGPFPPINNTNPSLYDNPKVNAAMDKGAQIADPQQRAQAWGDIDKMITEDVAAIPWFWDKLSNIEASNVHGVIAKWNATWDLPFVSVS